jgi:lipid-A-disaccharide synthase
MSPRSVMLIAGEPSGDLLAAELTAALRREIGGSPSFFGAGGARLAETGVELACDLTRHAVVGLVEVLRNLRQFKAVFDQLVELALHRRPDVIVCVDFSGFNRRFARQIRWEIQVRGLTGWKPRIVQYVSPQVWASRPGRARAMARDFDLVLAIFPIEKAWYAQHAPGLRVEFVGHPILDRHKAPPRPGPGLPKDSLSAPGQAWVVLLPGSRVGELKRHAAVMLEAFRLMAAQVPALRGVMVLPNESLAELVRPLAQADGVKVQVGKLPEALSQATVALASTGTVTMECALFQVPTVALYKTSWSTYQIGKRIIRVKYLAMPNILADEPLFPEFIQDAATPPQLSAAALDLIRDPVRRQAVQRRLGEVLLSLGGPGASVRAAQAILSLP